MLDSWNCSLLCSEFPALFCDLGCPSGDGLLTDLSSFLLCPFDDWGLARSFKWVQDRRISSLSPISRRSFDLSKLSVFSEAGSGSIVPSLSVRRSARSLFLFDRSPSPSIPPSLMDPLPRLVALVFGDPSQLSYFA